MTLRKRVQNSTQFVVVPMATSDFLGAHLNDESSLPVQEEGENALPINPYSAIDDATTDRRSLRLYSKKHRVYIFREFLLDTYATYLSAGDIVLDVAGGKGDLSWILCNVDDIQSVVMDPRRTINHIDKSVEFLRRHPDECRKRAIPNVSTYQPLAALMPHLERKEYQMQTPPHVRVFVDQDLVEAVRRVVQNAPNGLDNWKSYWNDATDRTVGFITPSGKNDFAIERVDVSENSIADADAALDLVLRAKLIVGYHPDQATDACFDLARVLRIPVCVVPCCTFPSEFPQRRFYDGTVERNVERYEDLIQYLLQENPSAKTKVLTFPGTTTARRIVIYTLPDDVGAT
jgi:hypothetical protein